MMVPSLNCPTEVLLGAVEQSGQQSRSPCGSQFDKDNLSVGQHHCHLGFCAACSSCLKGVSILEISKASYSEGAGGSSLSPGHWPVGSSPFNRGEMFGQLPPCVYLCNFRNPYALFRLPKTEEEHIALLPSIPGDRPSLRGLRVGPLPSWYHSTRLWPSGMCMECPPQPNIPSVSPFCEILTEHKALCCVLSWWKATGPPLDQYAKLKF